MSANNMRTKQFASILFIALLFGQGGGIGAAHANQGQSSAAMAANQVLRQFTLRNTVGQANQVLQGRVQEVGGKLRAAPMAAPGAFFPSSLGAVPAGFGVPQRDGNGRIMGYCAWDNTTDSDSANYRGGLSSSTQLLYAVVSPGLNGSFETSCDTIESLGQALGDDYVEIRFPAEASSQQYRSAVATVAALNATPGAEGDVRLVLENNQLYSYVSGAWRPVASLGPFTDTSGSQGAGAISYTSGKVTVAEFEAAAVTLNSTLNVVGASTFTGSISAGTATFGGAVTAPSFVGALTGNASTATALQNARAFSIAGDATAPAINFDGTGNVALNLTLANSGVMAGTYGSSTQIPMLTIDAKGRVTSAALASLDIAGTVASTEFPRLIVGNNSGVASKNVAVGSSNILGGAQSGLGGNVGVGINVLQNNSSGGQNTAVGLQAMQANTTGQQNSAYGAFALDANVAGNTNSAFGFNSLTNNTSGSSNAAFGAESMLANTTGQFNTAMGAAALVANSAGLRNAAFGYRAIIQATGSNNTAVGASAGERDTTTNYLTLGDNNTFLGAYASPVGTATRNFATAIGAYASVSTDNTIVLGRTTDTTVIGATGTASSGILQNKILQVTGDVGISGNLAIGGTFTAAGFSGNGSGLTNLNASNISSGTLSAAFGGTGVNSSTAANGQLLIGNGSGFALGNITGTANQVLVSNGEGSITLSLPQSIAATSTPTFGGLTLNGGLTGTTATFSGNVQANRLLLGDPTGVTNANIAIGSNNLAGVQSGFGANIAIGTDALQSNTTGSTNIGIGRRTLKDNTTGQGNLAIGDWALQYNTTGYLNVALGNDTLGSNTTGFYNLAIGNYALVSNTTGDSNLALGYLAMSDSTTGSDNAVFGNFAMFHNDSGMRNVALGASALGGNETGSDNVALGYRAGRATVADIRTNANITGNNNTFLGSYAMPGTTTQLNYATALGSESLVTTSNTIVLGRTSDTTVIGATGTASSGILQNKILQVTGDVGISGNLAIGGTFTATGFSGSGSGLTNLNGSNIASGTVGVAYGGTGVNGSTAANGQLLIGNGSGFSLATLTAGTGIGVSNGAGAITITNTGVTDFNGRTGTVSLLLGDVNNVSGFGTFNFTLGVGSLSPASTGAANTAVGQYAMASNTTGSQNTALGSRALFSNTIGYSNTALGREAMLANTTGVTNTAVGTSALSANTSGSNNTAIGDSSLIANTIGGGNTAVGKNTLLVNTTGDGNTVIGGFGLLANTTGVNNTAIGYSAGSAITTGSFNTFLGFGSDSTVNNLTYATAVGGASRVATSNTIVLGRTTDTTVIGATGTATSGILQNKILQVTGDVGISGNLAIGGTFTGNATTATALQNARAISITGDGTAAGVNFDGTGNVALNMTLANSGVTAGSYGSGSAVPVITVDAKGRITSITTQSVTGGGAGPFSRVVVSDSTGVSSPNIAIGTAGVLGGVQGGAGGNTAVGVDAMLSNTAGHSNVALGYEALRGANTAVNTAVGFQAMRNATGNSNAAFGFQSLLSSTGSNNTALGYWSMYINTSGGNNTAQGTRSLLGNTSGSNNTVQGYRALEGNTTGNNNVALGIQAGYATSGGTATNANTTGSNNTFLGSYAMPGTTTQLSYATALGSEALVTTSNTIVLGRTSDTVVIGATGTATSGVLLNKKLQVTGDIGATGDVAVGGTLTATGGITSTGVITANGGISVTGNITATGTITSSGNFSSTGSISANRIVVSNTTGVSNANISVGTNNVLALGQSGNGANTGVGVNALVSNTSGAFNTALGFSALNANSTGSWNTALGSNTLRFATTATDNTVVGNSAGLSITSGSQNTALGSNALGNTTTTNGNSALGYQALLGNSTGANNTGLGVGAGYATSGGVSTNANSTGSNNTFVGSFAMPGTTTQLSYATALGSEALVTTSNTIVLGRTNDTVVIGSTGISGGDKLQVTGNIAATGSVTSNRLIVSNSVGGVSNANMSVGTSNVLALGQSGNGGNTGVGVNTLVSNASGSFNTALGFSSLNANTGSWNTAIGNSALRFATSATENTVIGNAAGLSMSTGSKNAIVGAYGLQGNTTGTNNVALGINAGYATNVSDATNANTTGSNNTFLGSYAMPGTTTQLTYATALGSEALVTTSSTIVLGRTSDTTVIGATGAATSGTLLGGKLQVTGDIRASGNVYAAGVQLTSDRRLKTDINQVDNQSILDKLTQMGAYRYRLINDPSGQVRVGVIAQELATLFPELAQVNASGFYSVDYSALGTLAAAGVGQLNIQLKALDSTVQTQGKKLDELDTRVGQMDTRVKGLEEWKTGATSRMDNMQTAIDLNIEKIAEHALKISTNTEKIVSLERVTVAMDQRLGVAESTLERLNNTVGNSFAKSEDGQTLTVTTPNLVVSNFTAEQLRTRSAYTERLEAEMARIRELEVDNLRANTASAKMVRAETVNTGSAQVYAGVGSPAHLFAAPADGHYTVNASAMDGSHATATVIVNAGQAKVVPIASEGIELIAIGNAVRAVAAGKAIKASWIRMG